MSDRKYRQRGYQDDPRERERQAPKGPSGPRERPEGPRTPNLMASHEVFKCGPCGHPQALTVAADAQCERCGVALHSCVQCVSFDPGLAARMHAGDDGRGEGAGRAERREEHLPALRAAHDHRASDQLPRRRAPEQRATGVRRSVQVLKSSGPTSRLHVQVGDGRARRCDPGVLTTSDRRHRTGTGRALGAHRGDVPAMMRACTRSSIAAVT